MLKSKPPARRTAGRGSKLRSPIVAAALASSLLATLAGAPARAKTGALKILVAAPVSDRAGATMTQALWTKFVDVYASGEVIPYDGTGDPTMADCRRAGADYLLVAPFDLRPRLPGMPNAEGRVAARTHLVVTNCITGTAIVDQTINFDSDPPSSANAGDFESVPEITWAHSIPATLAKYPPAFERVARVTNVAGPFGFVDLRASAHVSVGDGLRDFATSGRVRRANPIVMTVTQVFEKYVQVTFSTVSGDVPVVGDLVEPIPQGAPPAPALASPAP